MFVTHTPLPQYPWPPWHCTVVGCHWHVLVQQMLDPSDSGVHWPFSWQLLQHELVSSHCSPISTTPLPHLGA